MDMTQDRKDKLWVRFLPMTVAMFLVGNIIYGAPVIYTIFERGFEPQYWFIYVWGLSMCFAGWFYGIKTVKSIRRLKRKYGKIDWNW